MRFRFYYIIGFVYIVILLFIFSLFIDGRILDVVDVYTPYLFHNQYFINFFNVWKIANNGGASSAPLSDLISGFLSIFELSPAMIQYAIFSILVLISYSSLFILFSYLSNNKYIIALILSIIFLYFEFGWAGLIYATGLNYFLAISPLIIYISIRINRNDIKKSRGIVYLAISIAVASFEITEAIPYVIFIYIPVFIMALLDNFLFVHTLKTLKIFLARQIIFFSGLFLSIIMMIYIYFIWIVAAFGITNNTSLSSLSSLYKTVNFFKANAFSSLGNGLILLGRAFLLNSTYAYYAGFILLIFGIAYLILKRKNSIAISAMFFIVLIAIYIQAAISLPNQLFLAISKIPIISSFFEVVNEPAQIYFLLFIWEYILVSMIIFDIYTWLTSDKIVERFKSISFGKSIINKRNIKYAKAVISIFIISLIIMMSFSEVQSVKLTADGNAGYTPYGHYKIPNYVPSYVQTIYNKIYCSSNNTGYQYTLLLPDYPRVERWNALSPFFYSFPPSNSYQMSTFKSFINDINSGQENGSGELMGEMDIGYIVVLNALNQSETGPTIGYDNFGQPYGILGNPQTFYNYFIKSPDYSLISKTDNYSIFKNIDNSGMFNVYNSAYYESNESFQFQSSPYSINKEPNITYELKPNNFLAGTISSSKWGELGNNIPIEFYNNTMLAKFPNLTKGYSVSYFNKGFAVSGGDKFIISSNITAMNSTNGIYYMGVVESYVNETIAPGKYWQNGLYHIVANSTTETSGVYIVPANVTYIKPFIQFYNAKGEFQIRNISMQLVTLSGNSSHAFNIQELPKNINITASAIDSAFSSNFPDSKMVGINTYFNNEINYSLYNGKISSSGIYVIMPTYQFSKYGYIGGDSNFSNLNPNSYIFRNISVKNGTYILAISISGYGYGNIYIDNISYPYNTLNTGHYLKIFNITACNNISIGVFNAVGNINFNDPLVVGPNISNNTERIIYGDEEPISYTVSSTDYSKNIGININSNTSVILVYKMNYNKGWILSYTQNGRVHHEEPILVNNWQMGYIVPANSTDISLTFHSSISMDIEKYITAILFPSILGVGLFFVVIDYYRNRRGA